MKTEREGQELLLLPLTAVRPRCVRWPVREARRASCLDFCNIITCKKPLPAQARRLFSFAHVQYKRRRGFCNTITAKLAESRLLLSDIERYRRGGLVNRSCKLYLHLGVDNNASPLS